MNVSRCRAGLSVVAVVAALSSESYGQTPVDTAFTYQGQLHQTGRPVNGLADFGFGLFDVPDGGDLITAQVNVFDVDVVNGRFSVPLDFGPEAFDGAARWLGIVVRFPAGVGQGVLLSPRQPITPVPYALHALNGGGGAGDGHSLDAADGDPVDALAVDNNGRVGVGTLTPLARQHVRAGNLALSPEAVFGDDLIVEGTDAVLGLYSENQGNAGSAIVFKELEQGLFTNTWGVFRDSSDNGGGLRFTFGPDPRYFDNPTVMYLSPEGGVGIGTTAPASRLTVDGVIESMAGGFRFPDGTRQTTAATGGGNGGVGESVWSQAGNNNIFYSAGNVGIGTSDPIAPLHIDGGSSLRPDSGGSLIIGDPANVHMALDGNRIFSRRGNDVFALAFNTAPGGDVFIGRGLGFVEPDARISWAQDRTIMFGSRTGMAQEIFEPRLTMSNEGIDFDGGARIRSSALELGDRVGIGTADPAHRLSVNGVIESMTGGFRFPDGTVQLTAATGGGGGGDGVWSQAGNDIFYNAGNVGIGEASPEVKLHLRGGRDAELAGGGHLVIGQTIGGTNLVLDNNEIMARDNGGPAPLRLNRDGGDVLMNSQGNGNVGIGTTTPETALHAVGADNNGTTATLTIQSGSQRMLLDGNEVDTEGTLFLNNNSTGNVVLVDGGGLVGIGTDDPAAPLDVAAGNNQMPSIVTRGGQDYATTEGQHMDFGHWDGATFTRRMRIRSDGEITIPDTTRYLSIPPTSFAPLSVLSTIAERFVNADGILAFRLISRGFPTGSTLRAGATVHLPHNAVVRELQAVVNDTAVDSTMTVTLFFLRQSTGEGGIVARVTSSPLAPGLETLIDDTPASATINNRDRTYLVEARWTEPIGGVMDLRSVRITYTVDSPLP